MFEAFYSAYQGDGQRVVELVKQDPSRFLYATPTGNTIFHAWLRIKRDDDESTFKLLHMFLDELRKSDRIVRNLEKLKERMLLYVKWSCEMAILLWTLDSLYLFHGLGSVDEVAGDINGVISQCRQNNASDEAKKKLLDLIVRPILRFHRPKALEKHWPKMLENQSMESTYYNASLFQSKPKEYLLDEIEKLYNRIE